MKLSLAVIAALVSAVQAFTVVPASTERSMQLNAAPLDRRELLTSAAALALAGAVVAPTAAFAAYVPKADDVKQIYFLGASLDRLADKLKNPDTVEAGLDGVRLFNKDANFYPGYAKNFIQKTVKKGSDTDPRVGYIKQACTLIGSIEQVAAGGGALMDKAAIAESISRVKKAQVLVGKFLAESGVQDEKFDAFIAAHK